MHAGKVKSAYLEQILAHLVIKGVATYEPPKQTRAVLLYWRLPEEWAEALHEWVQTISPVIFVRTRPDRLPCAGCKHRSAEHDPDILRDHGAANRVAAVWNTPDITQDGDRDPSEDGAGTDYRHPRW